MGAEMRRPPILTCASSSNWPCALHIEHSCSTMHYSVKADGGDRRAIMERSQLYPSIVSYCCPLYPTAVDCIPLLSSVFSGWWWPTNDGEKLIMIQCLVQSILYTTVYFTLQDKVATVCNANPQFQATDLRLEIVNLRCIVIASHLR